MLSRKLVYLLGFAAVVAFVGCSGGAGHPDTVKVTGKITYNGAPVAGALVSFAPEGEGYAASGRTDASGNFTLTSFESGDGAVPGKYKVTVSKMEQKVIQDEGEATEDNPDAAYLAAEAAGEDVMAAGGGGGGAEGAAAEEPKDLLPVKYKSIDTTDLTAEVTEGGENNFTFDLK